MATAHRLRLGPEDHGRAVAAGEYAEADFVAGWRYERVRGRLVLMPGIGQEHDDASEPWREELVLYKRLIRPDLIEKIMPEAWVRVDGGTDRIADIGVYLVTAQPVAKIPDRVPDLIFEVLSPGREAHERDFVEKRADYHRLGVREYVVIDRFLKRVVVSTYAPEGYDERILTLADTYTSPLLPGLAIRLVEVLAP